MSNDSNDRPDAPKCDGWGLHPYDCEPVPVPAGPESRFGYMQLPSGAVVVMTETDEQAIAITESVADALTIIPMLDNLEFVLGGEVKWGTIDFTRERP